MIGLGPKVVSSQGVVAMPFAWYQAAEGVSQSMLKLLGKSPAHLRAYLDEPKKESKVFKHGRLIHTSVFESKFFGDSCWLRPDSYQDKKGDWKVWNGNATACKDWLEAHSDRPVITVDELGMITAVTQSVLSHPAAKLALTTGLAEQSLFCTDPETGMKLKCRADWMSGNAFMDLKSCEDASLDGFSKSVATYGYDVQAAMTLDIADILNLGKEYFLFAAVEKTFPYAVAVYQLDEESIEIGRRKYRFWLARYKECVERNEWPGYETTIQLLTLPDWSKRKAA